MGMNSESRSHTELLVVGMPLSQSSKLGKASWNRFAAVAVWDLRCFIEEPWLRRPGASPTLPLMPKLPAPSAVRASAGDSQKVASSLALEPISVEGSVRSNGLRCNRLPHIPSRFSTVRSSPRSKPHMNPASPSTWLHACPARSQNERIFFALIAVRLVFRTVKSTLCD